MLLSCNLLLVHHHDASITITQLFFSFSFIYLLVHTLLAHILKIEIICTILHTFNDHLFFFSKKNYVSEIEDRFISKEKNLKIHARLDHIPTIRNRDRISAEEEEVSCRDLPVFRCKDLMLD